MFFMMIQPTHRKSINYNYMKIRNFIYFALAAALLSSCSKASDLGGSSTDPTPPTPVPTVPTPSEGWLDNYSGVMLQGFSWDSYEDTKWTNLTSQADELSKYFSLIWVPQSGNCKTDHKNMGYMPVYYFDQNSSFGTEAELRAMIKTFKDKGTGIVADVVVNHRNVEGNNGSWVDFPAEKYNNVTYQMHATDITRNDDNGKTAAQGYKLSDKDDEGTDWDGCRDLDHNSENVRNVIKAYVKYLKDDLGYTGFRYDMVKGFHGSHIAEYNDAVGIQYSVGEYWDNNDAIKNWINTTYKKSAAFDFRFRYNVSEAAQSGDWRKLNSQDNLIHDANYRRYAVTFIENHDMQDRGNAEGYKKDPITNDIAAANAYLLAMPGTPCVFLPHWKAYKNEIKAMIDARKIAGITNTSSYEVITSEANLFRAKIKGMYGNLIVCVGSKAGATSAENGYTNILSGNHYAYLLETKGAYSDKTILLSKVDGSYYNRVDVTVTATATANGGKLVYTLDGKQPTVNATAVPANGVITIDKSATLTVALVQNGAITSVVSHKYTINTFVAYTAKIYFKKPADWNNVYIWAWDANNSKLLGVEWPGKPMNVMTIRGETWYSYDFPVSVGGYTFNVIFNQGPGSSVQTVDITGLSKDTYYELGTKAGDGKYNVSDVTSKH